MTEQPKILFVVDDPGERDRVANLFAQAAPELKVAFAGSAAEALAAAKRTEFEAIFADLILDPMAGPQLLSEIWKVSPRSVRFFLSNWLEADLVGRVALGAHQFLKKPLDAEGLKSALARASSINRLVRNPKIQKLVSRIRTLPTRPAVYFEVMQEIRSPTASARSVGEIVAKDLGISTKLLQVANSAYFGAPGQISDPVMAVVRLGLEMTGAMVLSIEAFARFDKVRPLYLSADRVWRHSQAVAHAARRLAEAVSGEAELAHQAFTAGLLHDIGKLVLALNMEEEYEAALRLAQTRPCALSEAEAELLGATHAEAGAYLLSQWGLSQTIVDAVARHHAPARELAAPFTAASVLHLAERFERDQELKGQGLAVDETGLDYPAELVHPERMEQLRRIARGEETAAPLTEPGDGTMMLTREELQLATARSAVPAPPITPALVRNLPASPGRARSPRRVLLTLAAVAVAIASAIGYVHSAQARRAQQVVAAEASEQSRPPHDRNLLSNLLQESSEKRTPSGEDPLAKAKLQAILFDGDRSTILINGHRCRLGDTVEGARIVAVSRREVTLEHEGRTRTLALP